MAPVSAAASVDARELARTAVRWLARRQREDGNLEDPVTGAPLPSRHYAVCLFAASTCLMEDSGLREAGERAVGFYLGTEPGARGAPELNNLGLLRVAQVWERTGYAPAVRPRLERYLARMPFASLGGHATNNWHAMRAVCLLQRGLLWGRSRDLEAGLRCLRAQVLPRQGAGGLFADYPPRPGAGRRATPLTYHAKVCAMLAMFLRDLWDAPAARSLSRGVRALAGLCGPDGEALYFGRSCNSLYGYAAALYACRWALRLGVVEDGDRGRVGDAAARLERFLSRFRRDDGSLSPYPDPGGDPRGWDDYVTVPDYAAFASFLLLQLPPGPAPGQPGVPPEWNWEAAEDGLLVRARREGFVALSTVGQFHGGSYLFADARYSGMQVLAWTHRGAPVIPPPPHDRDRPTDPRWVGFMPVVTRGDRAYAVRVYDQVRVVDGPGVTAVVGAGRPVCVEPTALHEVSQRAGSGSWLRGALRAARRIADLSGLAPAAYRASSLPGVVVRRALLWWAERGCVAAIDRVDGPVDGAWTTLRTTTPPQGRGERWALPPGEVRLLGGAAAHPPEVREVRTSTGAGFVLRVPLAPGAVSVALVAAEAPVEASCTPTAGGVRLHVAGTPPLIVDLDALEVRP